MEADALLSAVRGIMTTRWGWPIAESLHFVGLCLLFGTVGFFDLRMLGCARGVHLKSLHRLVPVGVAGFLLSAATGAMFVATTPDQYLHNPAFLLKMGFLLLAGANMVGFYAIAARTAWLTPPGTLPPLPARMFGAISLLCWLGVITCGRVITAFRPPAYYWCLWC